MNMKPNSKAKTYKEQITYKKRFSVHGAAKYTIKESRDVHFKHFGFKFFKQFPPFLRRFYELDHDNIITFNYS